MGPSVKPSWEADPVPPPQLVGLVESLAVEVEVGVPTPVGSRLDRHPHPGPEVAVGEGEDPPGPGVEVEATLEVLVEIHVVLGNRRQRQAEGHHAQEEHRHDTRQAGAFPWGIVSLLAVFAWGLPSNPLHLAGGTLAPRPLADSSPPTPASGGGTFPPPFGRGDRQEGVCPPGAAGGKVPAAKRSGAGGRGATNRLPSGRTTPLSVPPASAGGKVPAAERSGAGGRGAPSFPTAWGSDRNGVLPAAEAAASLLDPGLDVRDRSADRVSTPLPLLVTVHRSHPETFAPTGRTSPNTRAASSRSSARRRSRRPSTRCSRPTISDPASGTRTVPGLPGSHRPDEGVERPGSESPWLGERRLAGTGTGPTSRPLRRRTRTRDRRNDRRMSHSEKSGTSTSTSTSVSEPTSTDRTTESANDVHPTRQTVGGGLSAGSRRPARSAGDGWWGR